MRFSIAGVCIAALLTAGCAATVPAPLERGGGSLLVSLPAADLHGCAPSAAAGVTGSLPAAGGGRPRTGYVGVGLALLFPSSRDLSRGWGVDLNYVQNITDNFSVEGALGTVGYDVDLEPLGQEGGFRATTFGAVAQYGRPFGTSRWYVGAGAAWWLNEATGLGDLDADDAAALIVEGGVDFSVSARANVDFEFRYVFSESMLRNGQDIALDLDAFAARVNCVFVF